VTLRRLISAARHPIAQNAAALYAVQFVLTVLPIVTLPWLAHALGPSEFGVVVFVQSFSFLLSILVEYGFGLSATRAVARERGDREALTRTVAGVQGAKLTLIAVVTVAAAAALALVPRFRAQPELLAFAWVLAVLQGANCGWFFTGVERMRINAAVEVSVRLAGAAAIIALVRHRGDGMVVLWIWTLSAAASLAVTSAIMYRTVPFRRPAVEARRDALRVGWPLFIATASVSLYTSATVFLLGLVVSSAQLALFSAAERVVRASMRATGALGAATYPRVSFLINSGRHDRAQRLSVLSLAALTTLGTITATLLIVLAPWIVRVFLGPQFAAATPILRILALLVPVVAIGSTLSSQWLLPRGLDAAATRIVAAAGLLNVVSTLVIGSRVGVQGVAWALVVLELGAMLAAVTVIRRRGLSPTRAQALGRVP
jgi:PST family polysaccharide transporter